MRIRSITCIIFAILVMVSSVCMPTSAASGRTGSELQTLINECKANKETAHEMAECARALRYTEDHIIIKTAGKKWQEQ